MDNSSRHIACTLMNLLAHIMIVACSLFTKQVCLRTVQRDDALWTPCDFEINYYFTYNNLWNHTIIITQQQNYTSYSSYSFFFVQEIIKEFKTIMLQSCPALIIKKPVNSHTCNVYHLAKVLFVLMSLNIYQSGKTSFQKFLPVRIYKTTAKNEAHIRTVALFMHFCTCY